MGSWPDALICYGIVFQDEEQQQALSDAENLEACECYGNVEVGYNQYHEASYLFIKQSSVEGDGMATELDLTSLLAMNSDAEQLKRWDSGLMKLCQEHGLKFETPRWWLVSDYG